MRSVEMLTLYELLCGPDMFISKVNFCRLDSHTHCHFVYLSPYLSPSPVLVVESGSLKDLENL